MKKKLAVLVAGTLAASMLLSGCSSNDASNDYVTVGGYKGIEVDDVEEPAEVTDDDVNNYIEAVRNQYATSEQITDRGVIAGDTVNIDFVGKIDGEAFDKGSAEGYDLQIGSGSFIDLRILLSVTHQVRHLTGMASSRMITVIIRIWQERMLHLPLQLITLMVRRSFRN